MHHTYTSYILLRYRLGRCLRGQESGYKTCILRVCMMLTYVYILLYSYTLLFIMCGYIYYVVCVVL